jgi:hypothetical protein
MQKAAIIGYTIVTGNPRDGFSLYGFFETQDQALMSAEDNRTITGDWWLMAVYEQEA